MNWEKAKTLTILFLLMINAFLLGLMYYSGRKYTMTAAQDAALAQYMSRNGVGAYANIPRSFRPMAVLRVQPSAYSANELALALLGRVDDGGISYDGGRATYVHSGERLVVEGDSFTYENADAREGFILTRANAVDACTRFLESHEKLLGKHVIDRVTETRDGGYRIVCAEKFYNRLIVSNSITFHVTDGGIAMASGVYNKPVGFAGEPREILSPDEAVYLFIKHMNYIYGDQEIILDGMDIVYYLAEMTTDSSVQLNAAPYYRFWVFSGEAQIMINAYTGEVHGGGY